MLPKDEEGHARDHGSERSLLSLQICTLGIHSLSASQQRPQTILHLSES